MLANAVTRSITVLGRVTGVKLVRFVCVISLSWLLILTLTSAYSKVSPVLVIE